VLSTLRNTRTLSDKVRIHTYRQRGDSGGRYGGGMRGGGALVHTLFCSVSDPDLFFKDLDPGFFSQSGSGSGSGSR